MTSYSNRLSVSKTHWHDRSLSSLISDTATFHSTHAYMELSYLDTPPLASIPRPHSAQPNPPTTATKFEATSMARIDSGFSDGICPITSSRRTSTSSIQRKSKRSYDSTPSSARSNTKRATRSSPTAAQTQPRTSKSNRRPLLSSRHTTPYPPTSKPYQFFQFPTPTLEPSQSEPETPQATELSPPLPTTCQYWTSDSTRRLEYAAIDAASRGVRGFFIKLVPDCILPPKVRRTRFHKNDDTDSDAGSVRRYRIPLPEEKVCPLGRQLKVEEEGSMVRPGFLKRLTSFGKKGSQ